MQTQALFYKYDPEQVSAALQFIWKMKLDEGDLNFIQKNNLSKDSNFSFLLKMPKAGENKVDQLIQYLEERKDYRDKSGETE